VVRLIERSRGDYSAALQCCAQAGLGGGIIFDALHVFAAKKADWDYVYTYNIRDFRATAPEELKARIAAP
jgi:hypothetical protein